jgi:hypothetical protein
MDLQEQRRVAVDRRLVVAQVRAVGGADLDQAHARRRHDLGHAERAADLDQLAARHDRRPTLREPREHEQHRGRVVVHDQRARRAGQQTQLVLDRRTARAALAAGEVEFEIAVAARRDLDRARGTRRERRTSEVGVQRDSGRIDHRLGMRARQLDCAHASAFAQLRLGRCGGVRGVTAQPRPLGVEHLARGAAARPQRQIARDPIERADQPIHRRKRSARFGLDLISRIHQPVNQIFRAALGVYTREARRIRSRATGGPVTGRSKEEARRSSRGIPIPCESFIGGCRRAGRAAGRCRGSTLVTGLHRKDTSCASQRFQ